MRVPDNHGERLEARLTKRRIHRGSCAALAFSLLFAPIGCGGGAQKATPRAPICDPNDLSGCIIEDVEVLGNHEIPDKDIQGKIATAESAHPLAGVLKGVPILGLTDVLGVEYERFDRFVLERDMERIERYYQARGFYDAHVRASRVRRRSDGAVRVEIVVQEGPPVLVRKVDLAWKDWRPEFGKRVTKPVTDAKNELGTGQRFEEEDYEKTKTAIHRALTDRGFPYADVVGNVKVDLLTHKADITYTIELGPRSTFGDIRFQGIDDLPEAHIRELIGFKKGDPFSTETLSSAELALSELGVFAAIDVKPELPEKGQPRVPVIPVTISVQQMPLRGVKLGAGAELGVRVEAHLVAGWEDRNFLGGLRRFSVEARPGIVLYPTRIITPTPTGLVPELTLRSEFRQPGVLDARTDAIVRAALKIYCLQIFCVPQQQPKPDDVRLLGYREYIGTVGLERRISDFQHYVGLFGNAQLEDPFMYAQFGIKKPAVPQGYARLLITNLEALGSLDYRRNGPRKIDRVNPDRGVYVGLSAQVAGPPGDATDLRFRPELRAYAPVAKPVTFAFRLVGGFLIPFNYGESFNRPPPADGGTEEERRLVAKDQQLLQLRGFFSGGPTSNRGYGYNGVGPQGKLGFLSPRADIEAQTLPIGGMTLWESSIELRFSLTENLGLVWFVDGSDVQLGAGKLRLTQPHLSTGLGLRYATPLGPIRADLGYRIPCAQKLGDCGPLTPDVGAAAYILEQPLAFAIAIGEAF
jgi:outer membrane protein insertion porin family/translocation and assembly module TamA